MTEKTITMKRTVVSHEDEEVTLTFPIYGRDLRTGYAGSIPYTDRTEFTRIGSDGRVTTITQHEECCREGKDLIVQWEISVEMVEESDLWRHLPEPGEVSSSEDFQLALDTARTWMGI